MFWLSWWKSTCAFNGSIPVVDCRRPWRAPRLLKNMRRLGQRLGLKVPLSWPAKNAENEAVWWIHGTWHAYFQTPSGIDRGEQESTHQHFERTRSQKSAEMTDLNGFGNYISLYIHIYPQFPLLLSENVRMWYCSPSSLARRIPSVYSCRCKMRSSWPQLVWDNHWICWSDIWKWDVKCFKKNVPFIGS